MNTTSRYPVTLRGLHWGIAGLVAAQAGLALIYATVYEAAPIAAETAVQLHMSFGVLLFGAVLLQVALRLVLPVPAVPQRMGGTQRLAMRGTYLGLYAVLLALPVTGWLKFAALGFPIIVFGLIPLPVFEFMPDLARRARTAHDLLAIALGVLLVLHVLMVLFSRRLTGQQVLPRMGIGQP